MSARALLLLAALAPLAGCAADKAEVSALARSRVAADYATYRVRRVGVLPFRGVALPPDDARAMQDAFAQALAREAGFEIVTLGPADLEEVPESEPLRRGYVRPETVLAIGRRYDVDAIVAGTVREARPFAPQRLAVDLDLVASETGLPIWSAGVALDAADARTRAALERWHATRRAGGAGGEAWDLTLISPRRFAEFAAAEVAAALPRR